MEILRNLSAFNLGATGALNADCGTLGCEPDSEPSTSSKEVNYSI
jgi:hypothetical protein